MENILNEAIKGQFVHRLEPVSYTHLDVYKRQNQTFTFNGVALNAAGTYLDTLQAANGCDSVVTLTLNVLPTATGAFTQTICANQTFTFNGATLNTAGNYLDTLQAANGCDSVVTLTLNVLPTSTGAFTPVSYTHLDVYKRQTLHHTVTGIGVQKIKLLFKHPS